MRQRNWLFDHMAAVSRVFAFEQVDAPVLESEELFVRKAGEEITDQLYNFEVSADSCLHAYVLQPVLHALLRWSYITGDQGSLLKDPQKHTSTYCCFIYTRPANAVHSNDHVAYIACMPCSSMQCYANPGIQSYATFIQIAGALLSTQDKGGRRMALRPEFTPSLARMVLQKGKGLALPVKWFTLAQCWRFERSTRGRRREHYQWNMDCIGELCCILHIDANRSHCSCKCKSICSMLLIK